MFNFSLQRLCFGAAFVKYLEDETLITLEEIVSDQWLDIKGHHDKGKFHLDLEDYLAGVILLSNELVSNSGF